MKKHPFSNLPAFFLCLSFTASLAFSQGVEERIYGKEHPFTIQELPAGKLKTKLETLNPKAKEKAMQWLHSISFKEFDAAEHLRVDNDGGVFIICPDGHGNCAGQAHQTASAPVSSGAELIVSSVKPGTGAASVSINNPPVYNSKPGATSHLYLDFNGATVSGKAWNTSYGVTSWSCAAWSEDTDVTTFTDTEQAYMKEVWQRMAEDYAPFDINVTTDKAYDPVNYTGNKNRVAWVLFTDTVDKNGKACPHDGAGGIAYVDVFGRSDYFSTYQPAWVTPSSTAYMSEAGSHEVGHNLGLSHDGTTSAGYYGGHGSNDISWNPIMGAALRNVSQWSKGEYYKANMFQDDLAIISGKLSYSTDDHDSVAGSATPLVVTGGTIITATTPENDPTNSSPQNKGIIEKNTDLDMFSFQTGAGPVVLHVNPWKQPQPTGTFGGNLDVSMKLYNDQGTLVASANPEIQTRASISTTLPAGTYYLTVQNSAAGTPSNASPTGYTNYGSLGQYFVSGTIVEATPMLRVISITPNIGDVTTTVSVAITGTLFQATPTVKLTKNGYSDILGTNVTFVDTENLTCDFDLTGAVLGDWNLVVTNPDMESATLPGSFTVQLPKVDFYKEYFDASSSLPTGWTTYSTTAATPLWEVVTTSSQTPNNSVFATSPSVISTKYLQSPSIPIPANAVDLKFSFWQDCKLETGYDGGTLEFSLDDGVTWFDVTSNGSGVGFESNGYNQIISSAYRSPIAGKYAWSGDSKGFIQSVIKITDPVKYSGKNLKARWLLASDNFAISEGWKIDTVEITGSIYVAPGDPDVNNLVVATEDDLTFVGNHGGPFLPTPQSYTLTNTGLTTLKWTANKGTSWVTLSASSGNLAAGETITLNTIINSNALALPVGIHADTISITNLLMPDDVITREISVEVNAIPATVTITNYTHTYSGLPKSVTVTTTPTGLPVDVTYNGISTPPTNAGTYTVVATVNHNRYAGTATFLMQINQVTPTVTWPTATSIPLGQAVSSATLIGGSASVSGSFSYDSPGTVLAVGTYAVPVTWGEEGGRDALNISKSHFVLN